MDAYNKLWKESDNIATLQLLAEKGVDINMFVNDERSKLNYSARNDKVDLVKFLLTLPGINVNSKSINGNTPLHMVSDIKIVKMLVEAGADINAIGETDQTPIMTMTNKSKVKYLVSKGADLTFKNKDGKTIYDLVDKSWFKTPLDFVKEQVENLDKPDILELINYLVTNKI